jgi:hypothetical protein
MNTRLLMQSPTWGGLTLDPEEGELDADFCYLGGSRLQRSASSSPPTHPLRRRFYQHSPRARVSTRWAEVSSRGESNQGGPASIFYSLVARSPKWPPSIFAGLFKTLALLLRYQGKYKMAEELNRRALKGCETMRGKDHPYPFAGHRVVTYILAPY